jgi:RHS repeat-associated protein
LGRPVQTIKENYGSAGKFVKSTITYDALGREDKMYHPFESTTNGVQAPPAYVTPFKYAEYEASPLSRPIKQYNEDGTFVSMAYGTNSIYEVIQLYVNSNPSLDIDDVVTWAVYYPANSLMKTTVTNENGKITEVFKDKLGRVILTRKKLNGTNVDTYNVYDDYGNLVMVIPPDAFETNGNPKMSLVFCYKYDNENRLHRKKVPGADWQKFYYDNRDLLTLTQDGNMRATSANRYIGTQYDDLGRVVKTGWVSTADPLNFAKSNFIIADNADKLTETEYYPNKSWVKHQGAKVLKPAGVSTLREWIWNYTEYRAGVSENTGNPVWQGRQHLRNLTNGVDNTKITDADAGGLDWWVSNYNGLQKPTLTNQYLFSTNNVTPSRTQKTFIYDNAQRLVEQTFAYGINGAGFGNLVTLSNMVYNHKDQLVEKNIGKMTIHNKFLQSIDYDYNARGWLTGINSFGIAGGNTPYSAQQIFTPQSTGNGTIINMAVAPFIKSALTAPPVIADDNADLYSQNIHYDNPDARYGVTPQSNGNISATSWFIAGRAIQSYGYTYDDLDRLTEAKYYDITIGGGGITAPHSTFSNDFKYNEKLTYDKRGNILTLQRNGLNGGAFTSTGYTGATYGLIDNLTYNINDKNQLTKVSDASLADKGFKFINSGQSVDYTYDANGNMIGDLAKGITSIQYNFLNLPQLITFTGNRIIQFVYDASGAKLRKIVNNNGIVTTYDYIGGVEFKGNDVERVANTEGAVTRNASGVFEYEYVLRDHLGNTRATFSDANNDGIVSSSDIKQINNYYPFGLNMEGNWTPSGANGGGNKYQYNGKELNDDFGLGWNDYGARFYDPAVARWITVDPLSSKMGRYSGYCYTFNNPVRFIDPLGLAPYTYDWESGTYKNAKGKTVEWDEVKGSIDKDTKTEVYYTNDIKDGMMGMHELGTKELGQVLNYASGILNKESNGIAGNIKFTQISPKKAKKYTMGSKGVAFVAFKVERFGSFGLSNLSPGNGAIGVFGIPEGGTNKEWLSYVNLGTISQNSGNMPDPIYSAGYTMAHEILHQLLYFASTLLDNDPKKFEHNNTTPNLNFDGLSLDFKWPLKKGSAYENILPEQQAYLIRYFNHLKTVGGFNQP